MSLQSASPFNMTPREISQYWLARGLHFLSLGDGTLWTRELGWQFSPTVTGTAYKPGPFGHAKGYYSTMGAGTTDGIHGPNVTMLEEVITCISHFYKNGNGGNAVGRFWDFQTNREAWYTGSTGALGWARFVQGTGSVAVVGSTLGIVPLNCWSSAAVQHDQRASTTNAKFYIEGVYKDEVAVGGGTYGAYLTNTSAVGNRTDGARGWDGMLGPQFRFSHPISGLTQQEIALLSTDPRMLFAPSDEILLMMETGGGGPTIVNATAGSYTWAGTNAPIQFNLNSTVGSYTWEGVSASLALNIAATVGSYTWQGVSATVPLLVSSTVGSYTWEGVTASFGGLVTVNATVGSYQWQGVAASLQYNLDASVGSYTWAGTAASIPLQISSTVGSYTWAGTAANLAFSLNSTVGEYAWQGVSAAIQRNLNASVGSYTWEGVTANFNVPTVLNATVGSYLWEGQVSTFHLSNYSANSSLYYRIDPDFSMRLGLGRLPFWSTFGRPANPKTGTLGFNIETNYLEMWTVDGWRGVALPLILAP